jgi:PAS domain S-box-containing protein
MQVPSLKLTDNIFRTLVDEAPVATAFYTGPEITIRYANRIMLGYWGKGASVIGKTFREALPELHDQHFPATLEKVYRTGQAYNGQQERADLVVGGKLQSFYFDFRYEPLRDSEGNIYGVHHTAVDVTKQVLAQRQLKESQERLDSVFRQAPVAITILRTRDFIIELANPFQLAFWERSAEEVIGKKLFDVFPEAAEQGFTQLLTQIMATGVPFEIAGHPVMLELKSGRKLRYFDLFYHPLRDADGEVEGIVAITTEVTSAVTARVQLEKSEQSLQVRVEERTAELAAAISELKRSNAHLEEFAHAASHDLKEPIRKINFFTERLKNQLSEKLTAEDERMFGRVEHAAQRMNALIDDLLLYSHVSQKPHQKEEVDLNEKIGRLLEDLELEIQEKEAVVTVDALPVVRGYRRQLQQLFHNLLTNAIKYRRPGIAPRISITAGKVSGKDVGLAAAEEYHRISVSDKGIGFEQEHADKIFQMFHRLHGKHEYEGTGVGLSIARKVADNHNGAIIAESLPGEGATFHVYLPIGI